MAPRPNKPIDEQRLRDWVFDKKFVDPQEKRDPDFLRDPAFTDNIVKLVLKEVNSAIKQQSRNLVDAIKEAYEEDLDVSELGTDTRRGRARKIELQSYDEQLLKLRTALLTASRKLDAVRLRQFNLTREVEQLKQEADDKLDWDARQTANCLLRVAKRQ